MALGEKKKSHQSAQTAAGEVRKDLERDAGFMAFIMLISTCNGCELTMQSESRTACAREGLVGC
jgi:hypothetical protein